MSKNKSDEVHMIAKMLYNQASANVFSEKNKIVLRYEDLPPKRKLPFYQAAIKFLRNQETSEEAGCGLDQTKEIFDGGF